MNFNTTLTFAIRIIFRVDSLYEVMCILLQHHVKPLIAFLLLFLFVSKINIETELLAIFRYAVHRMCVCEGEWSEWERVQLCTVHKPQNNRMK